MKENLAIVARVVICLLLFGLAAFAVAELPDGNDGGYIVGATQLTVPQNGGPGLFQVLGVVQVDPTSRHIYHEARNESTGEMYPLFNQCRVLNPKKRKGRVAIIEPIAVPDVRPGEHILLQTIVDGPPFNLESIPGGGEPDYIYSTEATVRSASGPGGGVWIDTKSSFDFDSTSIPLRLVAGETLTIIGTVEEGMYGYSLFAVDRTDIEWIQGEQKRIAHIPLGQMTPYASHVTTELEHDYQITVELDPHVIMNELSQREYLLVALHTPQGDHGHVTENIYHLVRLR